MRDTSTRVEPSRSQFSQHLASVLREEATPIMGWWTFQISPETQVNLETEVQLMRLFKSHISTHFLHLISTVYISKAMEMIYKDTGRSWTSNWEIQHSERNSSEILLALVCYSHLESVKIDADVDADPEFDTIHQRRHDRITKLDLIPNWTWNMKYELNWGRTLELDDKF